MCISMIILFILINQSSAICDGNILNDPDGICHMTNEEWNLLIKEPIIDHSWNEYDTSIKCINNFFYLYGLVFTSLIAYLIGRRSNNQSIYTSFLFLLIVLFLAGYIHEYWEMFQVREITVANNLSKGPPPGCQIFGSGLLNIKTSEINVFYSLGYSISDFFFKSKNEEDICIKYNQLINQSNYPNTLIVLTSFIGKTFVPIFDQLGIGMGKMSKAILNELNFIQQTIILFFLLVLILGCVYLLPRIVMACCVIGQPINHISKQRRRQELMNPNQIRQINQQRLNQYE
jgi:hypothetical protein